MKIQILSYNKKHFVIRDISHNVEFKIPEKTLIYILGLDPNVLCPALVDRTSTMTMTAIEN